MDQHVRDKGRIINVPDLSKESPTSGYWILIVSRFEPIASRFIIFAFLNRSNAATVGIARPSATPQPSHPSSDPVRSAQFCRNNRDSAAQCQQSAIIIRFAVKHMLPTAEMDYTKIYSAHERRGEGVGWVRERDQIREQEELRAAPGGARLDS